MKSSWFSRLLIITTGTSLGVLSTVYIQFPVTALGICSVLSTASALVLLEHNLGNHDDGKRLGATESSNGTLHRLAPRTEGDDTSAWTVIRDMSAVVAIVCMIASMSVERFKTHQWAHRVPAGPVLGQETTPTPVRNLFIQWNWDTREDLFAIAIECAKAMLLSSMVSGKHFPILGLASRALL
jgi:hypothetical protein